MIAFHATMKNTPLWAIIVLVCASTTQAQTIFFSDVATPGGGVTVDGQFQVTHDASDASGVLYLWVTGQQRVNQTLALDVHIDSDAIAFSSAEVVNPFIDVGVPSFSGNRWQGVGQGTVSDRSIINLVGVRVTEGFGLDPDVKGFDPLYDSISDAWLFARVDYDIVGQGLARVSVNPGQVDIVDEGISIAPRFELGDAMVEIVPQPSSVLLLVNGMGVLLLRRTQRQAT